jgi:hypothetical protein
MVESRQRPAMNAYSEFAALLALPVVAQFRRWMNANESE